jgi:hypothetical protein
MTSPSFECTCILKYFYHFFVTFLKLLYSHLFVQFGLTRVWRTRAACFRDTCILRQNVFPDLNVQYEQIISPLQRRNVGRHIVLVGLFLLLILFVQAVTLLSFDIDLWYLVCRCIIIRYCVMDHHDLHMTLTSDLKVK